MRKIGEFKPFLFENHLVIALDKEWIDLFGELPKFVVTIDSKRKLHIASTKSIQYTKSTN